MKIIILMSVIYISITNLAAQESKIEQVTEEKTTSKELSSKLSDIPHIVAFEEDSTMYCRVIKIENDKILYKIDSDILVMDKSENIEIYMNPFFKMKHADFSDEEDVIKDLKTEEVKKRRISRRRR